MKEHLVPVTIAACAARSPRKIVAVLVLAGLGFLGVPAAVADDTSSGPAPAGATATESPADSGGIVGVSGQDSGPGDPTSATGPAPTGEPTPPSPPSDQPEPTVASSDAPVAMPATTNEPSGEPMEEPTADRSTVAPASESSSVAAVSPPARHGREVAHADVAVLAQLPRVSFGQPDCTALTVAVYLDNTGSDSEATFRVFTPVAVGPQYDETVVLPGGAIQVVQVPLVIDHVVQVSVQVFVGSLVVYPSSGEFACRDLAKRDPRATVGKVDCARIRIPVTLDNTRSLEAVRFVVLAGTVDLVENGGPAYYDQRFEVGPGAVRVVQVPLSVVPDVASYNFVVEVFDENLFLNPWSDNVLALDEFIVFTCPRVTVRGVDCAHLTTAVTLDDNRSESATTFVVQSGDISVAGWPQHQRSVVLAGGQWETVVQVRVRNHTSFGVLVMKDVDPPGPGKEDVLLAKKLFDVNCGSPSARPTPNVSVLSAGASQLPATGGPGLQLPFAALLLISSGVVMLLVGRSTGDTATSPASKGTT